VGSRVIKSQKGPDVYKVDFLGLKRIYPVFHASLLEKYNPENLLRLKTQLAKNTLLSFSDEVRNVNKIKDRRKTGIGT
jgi:hypothetical protein